MSKKLYADRDIIQQGHHYIKHVSAMTEENLYHKSDIAAELAHRDIEIEALRLSNAKLTAALEAGQSGGGQCSGVQVDCFACGMDLHLRGETDSECPECGGKGFTLETCTHTTHPHNGEQGKTDKE